MRSKIVQSRDPREVRTGRKWRVEDVVQEAAVRMHKRSLVGVVTQGSVGLGYFPTPQTNTSMKERCHLGV